MTEPKMPPAAEAKISRITPLKVALTGKESVLIDPTDSDKKTVIVQYDYYKLLFPPETEEELSKIQAVPDSPIGVIQLVGDEGCTYEIVQEEEIFALHQPQKPQVPSALKETPIAQIDALVERFFREQGEPGLAVPPQIEVRRISMHDLEQDWMAFAEKILDERPTLEQTLTDFGFKLLARAPTTGTYTVVDQSSQTYPVDFTFDKILYFDPFKGELGLLAVPSERDKHSLDHLKYCNHRVENGGNSCTPITTLLDPDASLFMLAEDIHTLRGGSRVHLNTFGEGGMGILELYYNLVTGELEVLKSAKDAGGTLTTLRNEARILGKLKGKPGIVESKGLVELADGRECLITEYCDMTTNHLFRHYMREYLREKEMTGHSDKMNECFYMALEGMIESIKSLHDERVVYLDMKPSNILWKRDKDGRFVSRLIDFGTALTEEESRRRHILMLTPYTAEPELLIPYVYSVVYMKNDDILRLDYELQCDVYSLGRTMIDAIADVFGIDFDQPEYFTLCEQIGVESVPKLLEFNKQEIALLRKKNKEMGEPFSEDIIDLIETLTQVRTSRPSIDEIVVERKDRCSFCDAIPVEQVEPIAEQKILALKPKIGEDANTAFMHNLLVMMGHLEGMHARDDLYLTMRITPKGSIMMTNRMKLDDAKRSKRLYFDPVYVEPESLITLLGAYAASAYAKDSEVKSRLRRAARIDYEKESNVYTLGMAMAQMMGETLGIPRREKPKEWDSYFQGYIKDLATASPAELAEREPVNYLTREHQKLIAKVRLANDERRRYDPELIDLIEDMTKYRMNGRVSLAQAKSTVEALLKRYEQEEVTELTEDDLDEITQVRQAKSLSRGGSARSASERAAGFYTSKGSDLVGGGRDDVSASIAYLRKQDIKLSYSPASQEQGVIEDAPPKLTAADVQQKAGELADDVAAIFGKILADSKLK
ncbi:MAG: hypothetical protein KJ574_01225 [Nanoarchaeota archaeon]|nr:hypothetical protein [Nanoarchaeota archaeon]